MPKRKQEEPSALLADLDTLDIEPELVLVEKAKTQLQKKNRELVAARKALREVTSEAERLQVIADFKDTPLTGEPGWLKTPKKVRGHRATVCTMFSDIHLDEVTKPEEMSGFAAYNREIAEFRVKRYFENLVKVSRDYLAGVSYDGVVLMLGGDTVNGALHREYLETNEFPVPETIRHWTPRLAEGIAMLADVFGKVHVACVHGNHGRFTEKPQYKLSAMNNADWLISWLLAEKFAGDKRITFDIPEGFDCFVPVYGTTHLLMHGDRGGGRGAGNSGVIGKIISLKNKKRAQYVYQPFQTVVVGHYHTTVPAHSQEIMMSGATKGFDEFALANGFTPERPQHLMWTVTPENGITFTAPIYVSDPVAEGWGKHYEGWKHLV